MALPRYVYVSKKTGVSYVSGLQRAEYTIKELSRAALRDAGKFILMKARPKVPRITGIARRNLGAWVRTRQEHPDLQIGYKWYDKKNKRCHEGFYAAFFETGTANNPKLAPFYSTVLENLDEIRRIEGQYLSAIEDENRALGLINEEEVFLDETNTY